MFFGVNHFNASIRTKLGTDRTANAKIIVGDRTVNSPRAGLIIQRAIRLAHRMAQYFWGAIFFSDFHKLNQSLLNFEQQLPRLLIQVFVELLVLKILKKIRGYFWLATLG